MDIQVKGLKGHVATINFEQGQYQILPQDANLVYKNKKPLRPNKIYNFDIGGSDQYTIKGHKFTIVKDNVKEEKKKVDFDQYGATVAINNQQSQQEEEELSIGQKTKPKPEKSKIRKLNQMDPIIMIQQNSQEDQFQKPEVVSIKKKNKKQFNQFATTLAVQDDDDNDQKDDDGFLMPALPVKTSARKKKVEVKKFNQYETTQAIIDDDDDDDDRNVEIIKPTSAKSKSKPVIAFDQFATTQALVDQNDDEQQSDQKMQIESKKSNKFNEYSTTLAIDQNDQQDEFVPPVSKKPPPKRQSSKKFSEFAATIAINQDSDDDLPKVEPVKTYKKPNQKKEFVVPVKKAKVDQLAPTIMINEDSDDDVAVEKQEKVKEVKIKEVKKKDTPKKKPAPKKVAKKGALDDPDSLVNDIFGIDQEEQVKDPPKSQQIDKSPGKKSNVIESSEDDSDIQVKEVKSQATNKKNKAQASQTQSKASKYKKINEKEKPKEEEVEEEQEQQKVQQNSQRALRDTKLKIAISGIKKTRKMLNMVSKIGAKLVLNSDDDFDIVLIEKPQKTVKVIIAVAKGLPVISLDWLQASVKMKKQLDYEEFLLDWSEFLEGQKKTLPQKKFKLFKNNESVYVHSYLKDDDKKDVAGLVDDFKLIVKLVGGNVTISSAKADICILPTHYKSQKKIEGRRIEIAHLREAILNQRQIQYGKLIQ